MAERTEPVRAAADDLAIPIRPNLAYAAFLGLIAASLRRRTRVSWWIVVLFYFGPSFLGSLGAGFAKPVVFISGLAYLLVMALPGPRVTFLCGLLGPVAFLAAAWVRKRFTAQSMLAANGDREAMELDEEFLSALEYAMPPTGGLGMGVDRLMIMLTGRTIRDTVLFPLVRPQAVSPGRSPA